MCDDIGEILGRLREKSVFDYTARKNVLLVDSNSIDIDYKKNELLEVKRFAQHVSKHLPSLTYLVRNPTVESYTKEAERSDRIMGSVNHSATSRLQGEGLQGLSKVVCHEIHRSFDTPENRIVALILLSIANYCDRYLHLEDLKDIKKHIEPTVEDLKKVRACVTILLSARHVRQILPAAVTSADNVNILFSMVVTRIKKGRIPPIYHSMLRLLSQWRNNLYVQYNDLNIIKDILLYHALKLEDKNKLYEAWVFYHILYRLVEAYGKRFTEISGIDDTPVFASDDRSILIRYQPSYHSGWVDGGQQLNDTPDIVIEVDDGTTFVIDAKNSRHVEKSPRPNFRQMRSYLETTNAAFGLFVHSEAEQTGLWRTAEHMDGQTVIWTSFSPHTSGGIVDYGNIMKGIELIRNKEARKSSGAF